LDSAFAETPITAGQPAGEEVQPAAKPASDSTPQKRQTAEPTWTADQTAWFALRAEATTPEAIAAADAQAPEFSATEQAWITAHQSDPSDPSDQPALPPEVLTQVKAWETAGGALPPSLQAIVDKRLGRELHKAKELETRAATAEAEVTRLTEEIGNRQSAIGNPAVGGLDEKTLQTTIAASEKFRADARAFVGGYADDAQTAKLEAYMTKNGMDEKALRRQLDEVNQWLTEDAPQLRQNVQKFKATEREITPIVKARFPSLEKKDSQEAQWATEVAQLVPELSTRTPAHKLALGVYALGKVAWDHLSAASEEGDVIEALRGVLTKHVPVATNGIGNRQSAIGNGKRFFLPGKAPAKGPTGGRALMAPRVNGHQAAEEAASEELRQSPTAENVTKSLKIALR
jgi:predicted  nucleic acid-binding Zn-ribbon protein